MGTWRTIEGKGSKRKMEIKIFNVKNQRGSSNTTVLEKRKVRS